MIETQIKILQTELLDFSRFETTFLSKTLKKQANKLGYLTLDKFCKDVRTKQEIKNLVKQALSISYSEFFRGSLGFAFLKKEVLPELLKNKEALGQRELRIWSAACSKGQEAYSIAIIVNELLAKKKYNVNVQIFASDCLKENIEKAKLGLYSKEEIQNAPLKHIEKYFTPQGNNKFQVNDNIRKTVQFSIYDLFDTLNTSPPESIFGGFDILFCKNMLYYYNENSREIILERLDENLSIGGYLFVNEAEVSIANQLLSCESLPYIPILKKTKPA